MKHVNIGRAVFVVFFSLFYEVTGVDIRWQHGASVTYTAGLRQTITCVARDVGPCDIINIRRNTVQVDDISFNHVIESTPKLGIGTKRFGAAYTYEQNTLTATVRLTIKGTIKSDTGSYICRIDDSNSASVQLVVEERPPTTTRIPAPVPKVYTTPTFEGNITNNDQAPQQSNGAAIGAGVGVTLGLLVIAAIVIGAIFFMRKRNPKQTPAAAYDNNTYENINIS